MKIIFTGGAYYKVNDLQIGESDFTINDGHKWIKSQKKFAAKSKLFVCPKNAQVLTEEEFNKIMS